MTRTTDAVVIGSGPYGLSVTAHLRAAGVETRIFGSAMDFWRNNMPRGMFLRSHRDASHIADPEGSLSLDGFERFEGRRLARPTTLEDFVSYGSWFQRQSAPDLDHRRVVRIEPGSDGLRVVLDDGESFGARRIVVAAGLGLFAWRPPEFGELPRKVCTHSSEHSDLSILSGKRVIVVGGGQSAIESAVLLAESGAQVELAVRADGIRWLGRSERLGPLRKLLFPRSDVGPAFLGHIAGRPSIFRHLPVDLQHRLARRSIAPAGAGWLRPRARAVAITTGRAIRSVAANGSGCRVLLDDGTERTVDHVLLATGYRVDVARYPFLADVLDKVRRVDGYPVLDRNLQSSVPGLYFVGAPAARAFGPVVRFVSGTRYAARAVVRSVKGTTGRPVGTEAAFRSHYPIPSFIHAARRTRDPEIDGKVEA